MPVYGLDSEYLFFPNPEDANEDGLLAVGGLLREDWILSAYERGIFPWFNERDPVLWWSVDPRSVLFFDHLRVQKSMRPYLNSDEYIFTLDTAFEQVMKSCANAPGRGKSRTWISEEMMNVYTSLHQMGVAHSAEVWRDGELVGGLYGVSLGRAFFGESMFSIEKNMSKLAFIRFCRLLEERDFDFVDCQVPTSHLESLGAENISRTEYLRLLRKALEAPTQTGRWTV
ncbi:leucyl/phenylalanyl-tRNA--protein transferase [Cryomorphaceae bacterium 1068]|nr:leucyl/phenylalanyl-tRNA--protein transferase [Cryomorphaceae bacterium 1068]